MKKLLKTYGMDNDMQYFEMIVESFINGQITQAKKQFKAMPKAYRISFMKLVNNNWISGLSTDQIDSLYELI